MTMFTSIKPYAAVAVLLLGVGSAYAGDYIPEDEPNDPIANAKYVVSSATKEIKILGVLGTLDDVPKPIEDVDYFKFYGQAGDVVTFDIDGGIGGAKSVNTYMAVFGSAEDKYPRLRTNDDAKPCDEGSIPIPGTNKTQDARIDNFVLPKTGYYTVGVANSPRYFMDGGTAAYPEATKNGDYTLIITGVTPSVLNVPIAIKPGSGDSAPLNPKSKGKIPVAILTIPQFNAMEVDTASLTFGSTGDEDSLVKCNIIGEDVDGDGDLDLVCHFDAEKAGFNSDDLEGILKGQTKSGLSIEGRGDLKVVPIKSLLLQRNNNK